MASKSAAAKVSAIFELIGTPTMSAAKREQLRSMCSSLLTGDADLREITDDPEGTNDAEGIPTEVVERIMKLLEGKLNAGDVKQLKALLAGEEADEQGAMDRAVAALTPSSRAMVSYLLKSYRKGQPPMEEARMALDSALCVAPPAAAAVVRRALVQAQRRAVPAMAMDAARRDARPSIVERLNLGRTV